MRNNVDPRGRKFDPKRIGAKKYMPKKEVVMREKESDCEDDESDEDASYDSDDEADNNDAIGEYEEMPESGLLLQEMNKSEWL